MVTINGDVRYKREDLFSDSELEELELNSFSVDTDVCLAMLREVDYIRSPHSIEELSFKHAGRRKGATRFSQKKARSQPFPVEEQDLSAAYPAGSEQANPKLKFDKILPKVRTEPDVDVSNKNLLIISSVAIFIISGLVLGSSFLYFSKLGTDTDFVSEHAVEVVVPAEESLAKEVLLSYFQAENINNAYGYVLKDAQMLKTMDAYWKPLSVDSTLLLDEKLLADGETTSFFYAVQTKESGDLYYYVLYNPEFGYKVDWRESNDIDDMSLTDFKSSKSKENVILRGEGSLSDKYIENFGKEQYIAIKLSDRSGVSIVGYLAKGTADSDVFLEAYEKAQRLGNISFRVSLEVKKIQDHYDVMKVSKVNSLAPQEDHLFDLAIPYYRL